MLRPIWSWWAAPSLGIITNSDRTPMASVSDAVSTMDHGHKSGIAKPGRDFWQLGSTEFARAEFANVFIGFRMFSEPAPIGFDSLFDVIER